MKHKIKIGNINLDLLKTDEDIRQEAKKHVGHVLVDMGEAAAADAWKALQKSVFKPSPSDKHKFIREGGQNFKKTASLQERQNVENLIFETIKGMKEESEDSPVK